MQNAGGENAEDGGTATTTPAETNASPTGTVSAAPASAASDDDDSDWLALVVGSAGLILGFVALVLVLTRRREAT